MGVAGIPDLHACEVVPAHCTTLSTISKVTNTARKLIEDTQPDLSCLSNLVENSI